MRGLQRRQERVVLPVSMLLVWQAWLMLPAAAAAAGGSSCRWGVEQCQMVRSCGYVGGGGGGGDGGDGTGDG